MVLVKYKINRNMFLVNKWDEIIDGPFNKDIIEEIIKDPESMIVEAKQLKDGIVVWECAK